MRVVGSSELIRSIACGAASGFHSLVSSGTTAKQLDREPQARPIGYGAMIGESLLGLAAVAILTLGSPVLAALQRDAALAPLYRIGAPIAGAYALAWFVRRQWT